MSGENETRFVELMSELFQLDEAEALDFGIYRIIRRHNDQIEKFLGKIVSDGKFRTLQGGQLATILDHAFAQGHDKADSRIAELETELDLTPEMSASARDDALSKIAALPPMKPLVAEYRQLCRSRSEASSKELDRAEVLNHLYRFFSRHYQDGDFIVERRIGRDGARYIRSTGDDTEFHWATEDMYYIKSGDIFTDYPVRLANGQRIVFSVDPASLQETRAALKPSDKAHYELATAMAEGDCIRVLLKYVKGAGKEGHKTAIVEVVQKVGAGGTADTAKDIARWLNRFVARNQSDFFIHKRLKAALTEDLDIYLKTDVLNADQLLADADLAARTIKVGRVVREVGNQIIDFLAALEDFQKMLWEKKKLVFQTRYVITLDRLERYCPDWLALHMPTIVTKQAAEWKALGLGNYKKPADCIKQIEGDMVTPPSQHFLPLPVDTGNFDPDFKWGLLNAVTEYAALDDALDGVAIHSDNWQALSTISRLYADRVKCAYIDPPYNTGGDGFPYKDAYPRASWIAMIASRLEITVGLISKNGAIFASIDHIERDSLCRMLGRTFGEKNRVEEIIWSQTIGSKNQSPTYSTNHEYVEVYARDIGTASSDERMFREPKPGASDLLELAERINSDFPSVGEIESKIKQLFEKHKSEFKAEIECQGIEYDKSHDPWRGLYNYCRAEYRDKAGRLVTESKAKQNEAKIWIWRTDPASMPQGKQAENTSDPNVSNYRLYEPLHPITNKRCKRPSRGWAFPLKPDPLAPDRVSFESLDKDSRIAWGENESKMPEQKKFLHEIDTQVGKSVITDNTSGEKELTNLTGLSRTFPNPKPTTLIERFFLQTTGERDWVLDFFAGSGTTYHAARSAFHTDRKQRKTILIETGNHYETVLVPRLKRVAASWRWNSGKPSAINGQGCFIKLFSMEQYEDAIENLDVEFRDGSSIKLPFENSAFALHYRLDQLSRSLYCSVERFSSPFGYQLKRADGGGEAQSCEVDLVESLPYLLGMDVARLYREESGVVLLGRNRREQSVAVFFRECSDPTSSGWVQRKMAEHPADRVYVNAPAGLAFEGAERLEAIEAVFAQQFGRAV